MKARLFTDGGARGNPGPAGIGVVLLGEDDVLIYRLARSLGESTNNVAEYSALIAGLEAALERGVTDLEVFVDSELVVHQVQGEWKIKTEHLRPLAVKAKALLGRFPAAVIEHVPRSLNAEADELANEAMDAAAGGSDLLVEKVEQRSMFDPR
ncbi:MAG: ribonuclease HI family protein [Actinomycetota bacterium]